MITEKQKQREELEEMILCGVIMYNALEYVSFLKPINFTGERRSLFGMLLEMDEAIDMKSVAHRARAIKIKEPLYLVAHICRTHVHPERLHSFGLLLLEYDFREHAIKELSKFAGGKTLDLNEYTTAMDVLGELGDESKDIFSTVYGARRFFEYTNSKKAVAVMDKIIKSMDGRALQIFSDVRIKELERKLEEAKAIRKDLVTYASTI